MFYTHTLIMKLQPNALRWDFTTDKVKWLGRCFGWWDALCHYMPHMKIGFIFSIGKWVLWLDSSILFHMTPIKSKSHLCFSLLLGSHGFGFSFGKNITLPFAFCWVVMVFVLPLAKTSHCLFPLVGWWWLFVFPLAKHHIFVLFAMLGNENSTKAFCF